MTKLCFDYDPVVYKACCAVESRKIKVTNKHNGKSEVFKTRTEFYGHYKKKAGGWLAVQLAKGSEWTLDDYEIEDFTEVQPVENALSVVKSSIENLVRDLDADEYMGFVGGQGNYRKELATLLEYKGNRKALQVPVHLQAAREYVIKYHKASVPVMIEPDDATATVAYSASLTGEDIICVVGEKDFKGCQGRFYYVHENKLEDQRGFGYLERTDKGVKGIGRMFKYWQVCSEDLSDNYKAHCFSDFPNGAITAYDALKDCKNDKEAFLAMQKHFKYLYPEPKKVIGWRGNEIEIDWLYVMQEMFHLAHLERWPGDRINVREVFNKLGIDL